MERGGFHGYHHKLPRMISSSDLTHQAIAMSDQMMNSKQQMMSHGSSNGRMMIPHDQMLNNSSNGKSNAGGSSEDPNECIVREQDRFMPIANVIRIMRKTLPPHAKISDDAKETIQECVSEFISFITGEANERCQREQRKTITAEDVLWAMSKLGFDDYVDPLTLYLHRYRELEGDRGASLRGDPLVKRAYDFATASPVGMQYPPVYHMAGYYAPPPPPGGNAYIKEAPPYGQHNKE